MSRRAALADLEGYAPRPSVVLALDRSLRAFGGAPTYALTDNEKTVTTDRVCGIAVRNPQIVAASRHYGLSVATYVPADPDPGGRRRNEQGAAQDGRGGR